MPDDRSDDPLARTATAPVSTTGATPSDAKPIGHTLGRYRLERELGVGGMGVVHAAFDPDLERRVALKVLRSAGGEEARQRLLREARALARLTHPNVVTVHEVGSANGRDYVAMELIEGETLADWLKSAKRRPHEIIAAFAAAGRGLAAAHAAGLVHRDFKPHNVLRRKDGRIVVTDFGLARGVEVAVELEATLRMQASDPKQENTPNALSELTETGSVLGTPAYMAPEQWSGESVGPPADQFAFCVALWEALAGERPFRGGTLDALRVAVTRGPSELDDSKVPRRLRTPLKRGLVPDPAKRWPNMDALIAAITRAERPRGAMLMIASSAVVAGAIAYTVVGTDEPQPVAIPTCEAPVVDPAGVWSPAIANDVRAKTSPEVMRRFDALVGGWHSARGVACSLEMPMRARRLACLDGVIVRLDAVRKASVRRGKPALDDVGTQLIDPGICNVEDPPRLPTRLTEAAVTGLALAYQPDSQLDFDETAEAAALEAAGDDKCARGFVRLARAHADESTKSRDAAEEALQLADACGDDRMRADAVVTSLAMQVTAFLDPKLQKMLGAAEAAVRKVAQPDLVARLDLVKADIASASDRFDEQIKLAESAIRGFGEQRPRARLAAVLTKVEALMRRQQASDLKAARDELAHWRPEVERVGKPRVIARFDSLEASAQWELGDIAGANARFAELYERRQRERRKPATGGLTIDGVVVDAAGKPVADAVVSAGSVLAADSIAVGYIGDFDATRIGRTDAQGRYHLEHVESNAIIVAQHGDRRSRVRPVKADDRLVLQPTTKISGRVIDPQPHELTVFAVPVERDTSTMFQMVTPVAADGSFTIERVPLGRLRIGAAVGAGVASQALETQEVSVGAKGLANIEVRRARARKLGVVVRSSVAVPLAGAQVFVVSGVVNIKTVKDVSTALRSAGMAVEIARVATGETPPELGKLVAGDLIATFASAPNGVATACALGLSGDFTDPSFREKVQRNVDQLEVRCVPVAPDAKAVTIEVPPMKRLD